MRPSVTIGGTEGGFVGGVEGGVGCAGGDVDPEGGEAEGQMRKKHGEEI